MPSSVPFSFSTDDFPESERFDAYHRLYAGGTNVIQTGPDFHAHVRAVSLGCIVAFDRRLNAVAHERTAERVRQTGFEHFTVQLNLSGRFHVEAGTGRKSVEPGQVVLFDMTQPMRNEADQAHILTFSVAREVVESAVPEAGTLHGRILSSDMCGLLADYMMSLVNRAPTLAAPAAAGASRVFATLLTSALSACLPSVSEPAAMTRRERARRHIERNLGSADLGPDTIAQAIGVSRSSLYALFQPLGGVAKYIQMRRLARLRAALARPMESRQVAQLCYESGFASESHASRAFRQVYGMPPGQFRVSMYDAPRIDNLLPDATTPVFYDWIRHLHGPTAH
jgi:AraC-like DNA-binding protein